MAERETDEVCDVDTDGLPLGEMDALALTEIVTDTVENVDGEGVTDDDEDAEMDADSDTVPLAVKHDVGLCDTLAEPLRLGPAVTENEEEPHDVADSDTLEVGETVPEDDESPELVTDTEAVEEAEGQAEELGVPLSRGLTVPVKDAVPHEDSDTDALDEKVRAAEADAQPEADTVVEMETDGETVPATL